MNAWATFSEGLLKTEIQKYLITLFSFFRQNQLLDLLKGPVDHLAIKSANSQQFEIFLDSLKSFSESLSYVNLNNRRLATAILKNRYKFGDLGSSKILELMEPRPEKANRDFVGFEHIELRVSDSKLKSIVTQLKKSNLLLEFQHNPAHDAAVVRINNSGQEVKFSNKNLQEIIHHELTSGKSVKIL